MSVGAARTPQTTSSKTASYTWRGLALYAGFIAGLAPMFGALTDSVSSDTIYVMAGLMLLASLLLHDYDYDDYYTTGKDLHASLGGLSTGTFAAVCLASRLGGAEEDDTLSAFAVVFFALPAFKLWPDVRRIASGRATIYLHHPSFSLLLVTQGLLTWLPALLTVRAAWQLNPLAGIALTATLGAVALVVPALLVWLHRYKDVIRGPWDQAIPSTSRQIFY